MVLGRRSAGGQPRRARRPLGFSARKAKLGTDAIPRGAGRTTAMSGARARARAFHGLLASGLVLVVACGRTEPSRTPLSPPAAQANGRVRPNTSRAAESGDAPEDRDEVEIVVTPS